MNALLWRLHSWIMRQTTSYHPANTLYFCRASLKEGMSCINSAPEIANHRLYITLVQLGSCSHICWMNMNLFAKYAHLSLQVARITPTTKTTCRYHPKSITISPLGTHIIYCRHNYAQKRPEWPFSYSFYYIFVETIQSLYRIYHQHHSKSGFSQVHRTKGDTCCVASKVG